MFSSFLPITFLPTNPNFTLSQAFVYYKRDERQFGADSIKKKN